MQRSQNIEKVNVLFAAVEKAQKWRRQN